jgi:hypothetical protein
MASFEQHCRDCEAILGDRHEAVNGWLDSYFATLGSDHRRRSHHADGVREARELFGLEGAKAAVVHIVRDCGRVPQERDYDRPYSPCIELAPAECIEPGIDALSKKAEEEIKRILGSAVRLARHPPDQWKVQS